MKYSLWFPTHGAHDGSLRGWLRDLFQHQPAYKLDGTRQAIVARSITELCLDRGWRLVSIEPGEMKVSAVVECERKPERVIHDFKLTASRALASLDGYGPAIRRFNRRAHFRQLDDSQRSANAAAAE